MQHLHSAHKSVASITGEQVDPVAGHITTSDYITVDKNRVYVTIQDGPICLVGINGVQVTDMLEFVKEVYKSLNSAYPCRENSLTITKIEEAIHWQDARTKDREGRGVEGKNEE